MLAVGKGGLASSAWHIQQMGQPPHLGCLGMCTEPCAVIDVNSKSLRNMSVPAYKARRMQDKWGKYGKCRSRRVSEVCRSASEGARRALENVDEGRCCWASALVQVPGQPWPPALI